MKKKLIVLALFVSMIFSVAALFGAPPSTTFDKENQYDDDGYWIGCPDPGTTCAHFPPKY